MLRGHAYTIPEDDPDQYRFKRQSTWDASYGGGVLIRAPKKRINKPMLWAAVILLTLTAAMLMTGGA